MSETTERLRERAEPFLVQCGSCDAGLPMMCACTDADPRPLIAELLAKAEAHDALVAAVRGVLDADQAWSGNPDEAGRLTRAIERLRDAYLATAALRVATEDAATSGGGRGGRE